MDFISIFSKSRTWDWVFILTYDLSLTPFFETEIINRVSIKKNMTVALDYGNYKKIVSNDSFSPNYMGVYYNLEPIKVKKGGRFHPKLYLFLSETVMQLYVGSVNLTQSGFKLNYENIIPLMFHIDKIDKEEIDLLLQIKEFLIKSFINKNKLIEEPNPLMKNTVTNIISSPFFQKVEELNKNLKEKTVRKYHFLYTVKEGFISQIENIINQDIDKFYALSPYFDQDLQFYIDFDSKFKNVEIYVPHERSTFPKEIFAKNKKKLKNISVKTAEKEDRSYRFIHAKCYQFCSKKKKWNFVTSGNFTNPGFKNDKYPRNFEIGLLFPGTKRFLKDADLKTKKIETFEALITDENDDRRELPGENVSLDIESAFFNNDKINIIFNPNFIKNADIKHFKLQLIIDGIEENSYNIILDKKDYFIEPLLEIEGGALTQTRLISKNNDYKGAAAFVSREKHDPNYLPTLGATVFNECVRISGVEGLKKAFKYAKSSGRDDWLLYLLAHWNLEKILHGVNKDAPEDQSDAEIDDVVPTLPQKRNPLTPKKKVHKNIAVLMSSIRMHKNIDQFLETLGGISNSFKELIKNYLKYSFPIFLQINVYFNSILRREEEKWRKLPSIQYPEYTWLHNYKEYYSYLFLIYKSLIDKLQGDIKSLPKNICFEFIAYVLLWVNLNTQKTLEELRSDKKFDNLHSILIKLFKTCEVNINDRVISEVLAIYKEYDVPPERLLNLLREKE